MSGAVVITSTMLLPGATALPAVHERVLEGLTSSEALALFKFLDVTDHSSTLADLADRWELKHCSPRAWRAAHQANTPCRGFSRSWRCHFVMSGASTRCPSPKPPTRGYRRAQAPRAHAAARFRLLTNLPARRAAGVCPCPEGRCPLAAGRMDPIGHATRGLPLRQPCSRSHSTEGINRGRIQMKARKQNNCYSYLRDCR